MSQFPVLTHTIAIRWMQVFNYRIKVFQDCFNAHKHKAQDCRQLQDSFYNTYICTDFPRKESLSIIFWPVLAMCILQFGDFITKINYIQAENQ